MLKIKALEAVENHKLKVIFSDDTEKTCDISEFMDKGAFMELEDETLFRQVKNTGFSAEWPNEIDLSSDTLYAIGR
jgi:hypothetical protein